MLWVFPACGAPNDSSPESKSSISTASADSRPPSDSVSPSDSAAPDDTSEPVDTADTARPSDTSEPVDSGEPPPLHGTVLAPPLAPPTFELLDQHAVLHTSDSLTGAPTVVWFFRDTASSCTNDACGYRDMQTAFDDLGVRIVGVGPTSVEDNAAWSTSLDYRYQIWSDPEGVLAAAYDTESEFDEGSLRHAFVLDSTGHAILRYEGAVSVGADPSQVLADCRRMFAIE